MIPSEIESKEERTQMSSPGRSTEEVETTPDLAALGESRGGHTVAVKGLRAFYGGQEAVKGIDTLLLEAEPEVAWQDVAGMRDRLAHHYFDTSHAIVQATIDHDLPVLLAGVERLLRDTT